MRLTILGCAGSVPGPNTNASGYLLEADGFVLGLELGNGTVSQLQADRSPFDLDALVFSHLHPDHCADFGALTVIRRYHPHWPEGTPVRLPVYGPADTEQRLINLYAPNEPERAETDLGDVYQFHPLPTTEPFQIGTFEVTAYEVLHPTPAYGLRVSHGDTTLAYTGDTGVCPALDVLARDADVLLSEASWTDADDRPLGVHMSGVEAGQLAHRARARRLLLTHVAPWTDRAKIYAEARTTFDGPLELVEQGSVYDI
ncbi:MAG: MBL fold metallo-hydrolase [Actinophytocola sp.]|nr:MBL fold metallo-hydrolase [Actinophytocola sp.]